MIVCGLEGVGLRTVEQLRVAEVPVVVLDDDPSARMAALVESWGCPHFKSDGDPGVQLRAAGVAGARAVVCTQVSDLRNVETALLVRDLREDISVVVHLDNPTVGRAVEDATGAGSALDVAGLFAPSVVDACMGRTSYDVMLGEELFVAAEVTAREEGTLRSLFGDLAPVGIITAAGELVVCPGRDHAVGVGDRVTVLGKPEDLTEVGVRGGSGAGGARAKRARPARGGRSLRRVARRVSRTFAEEADRALLITLLLGLLLLLVSTVVLRLGYHAPITHHRLSVEDAVYFTVETVATVGFGDFSFASQPAWLEAFGILLIVAGTTLVTTIFALLTNVLVSRRIEQSLGQGSIHGMEDHVVLVGLGAVGLRVLEGLRALGREVVVVEYDERNRYVQHARSLGVPIVHGDATLGQTLRQVNIAEAGAVAILTSDDLVNLETGLAVRDSLGARWSEVPVVLRVFDRALGNRLEEDVQVPPRLVDLGAGGAVVRRRGARPGGAGDVLRAQPAVSRRASHRSPRRRARRSGDARAVRADPRRGDRARGLRRRDGAPAAARHALRRRRPGLPRRTVRGATARARARTRDRGRELLRGLDTFHR